jgi:uncharacterized membrane protein YbhN (UPF0104 family)
MSARDTLARARRFVAVPAVKRSIVIGILVLTVLAFVHFFVQHPEYFRALGKVSPWTIVWVILLNVVMIGILMLSTEATLRLCGKSLKLKENFLLTSYSSIANFFGPLQSGPGVRAVYLKRQHQVRLRDYTLATLIALGLFACFSALFLLVGTRPWWQVLIALIAVAGVSTFVIRLFRGRDTQSSASQFVLRPKVLAALFVLTFLQTCVTVAWYFVELRAVDSSIHFSQALSYAGAANFSLFVSITPDGVGIREAFLLFSQHIHHVSTATIVSANVIDRAAYVIFLGLLFLLVLALHAKDKLRLRTKN